MLILLTTILLIVYIGKEYHLIYRLISILVINEILHSFQRQYKRKAVFNRANKHSKKIGKPLLVIGDPYNGIGSKFHGPAYGCGDLCSDLTGCPKCKNSIKNELPNGLGHIPDNSHVVYISYVLEYVEQFSDTVRELQRIGGDNIFLLRVQPTCMTSLLYPGKRRVLYSDPIHK